MNAGDMGLRYSLPKGMLEDQDLHGVILVDLMAAIEEVSK